MNKVIDDEGCISQRVATLVGYHGYQNLGDDIFLRVICRWLRESLSIKKCYLSTNSDMTDRLVSGIHVVPFRNPVTSISRMQWIGIFIKAFQSDALILSAGSIFTIQPFLLIYFILRILKTCRGSNLRIMAIGVSIGPFKSTRDRFWCLKGLSLMDHVVLRDSQSKLLTDSAKTFINTQVSFDLALTLNEKFRTKKIQKQYDTIGLVITERAVGMCGSNHTSGCLTILNALDKALRDFSQAKVRILCICNDQRDGDRDISQHVHHTLTARWGSRIQVMYYEEEKIEDMLNAIEECSLLISARLHAGIMGILSAVPVYQISYAEKIRNIFVHSELSTEYLFDHANITQQSISEFIARAIKGKLTEFANNQQVLLKEKGQRVISCLDNVVR